MTDFDATEPLHISIESIRAKNNGEEMQITAVMENGSARDIHKLVILTEQYCALKPKKGPITEEQFEALETAARLCGALRSGQSALAYGSASVLHLTQKIMRHGYSKEDAAAAAERLRDAGLINEGAQVEHEVEKCLRKLWGARRIQNHLWSKGFAKDTLQSLPVLLENVDFAENCAALIRKHCGALPEEAAERKKLYASLTRYGYSPDEIREAFRKTKT